MESVLRIGGFQIHLLTFKVTNSTFELQEEAIPFFFFMRLNEHIMLAETMNVQDHSLWVASSTRQILAIGCN